MINNLIFIALIVLAVTEVIFIVAIIKMGGKLKELNRIYDFVHEIMKGDSEMLDKISCGIDEQAETYEKMFNLVDILGEQYKTIISSHEQILEAYLIISNGYKEMKENHKTLLKCWKEVADNADTASTQFKLCTEELKKIKPNELKEEMNKGFEQSIEELKKIKPDELKEEMNKGFEQIRKLMLSLMSPWEVDSDLLGQTITENSKVIEFSNPNDILNNWHEIYAEKVKADL